MKCEDRWNLIPKVDAEDLMAEEEEEVIKEIEKKKVEDK